MYDTIDKSALKPGDVVGVRLKTQIGWGFFRYPKTIPVTIKRITPARAKFVTTDGRKFGKHDSFYHITSETNRHTHVAICAERIYRSLTKLEELRRSGDLFKQDDYFIEKASELLEQICKEVQE